MEKHKAPNRRLFAFYILIIPPHYRTAKFKTDVILPINALVIFWGVWAGDAWGFLLKGRRWPSGQSCCHSAKSHRPLAKAPNPPRSRQETAHSLEIRSPAGIEYAPKTADSRDRPEFQSVRLDHQRRALQRAPYH